MTARAHNRESCGRNVEKPASYAPEGLSRAEAARYVGVSATTFDELVSVGEMPRPRRFRTVRRLVWLRRELDEALEDLAVDGAPAADPYDGVQL